MVNYREVNTLSPVDAAYLAGLVDGEGTITLSRKHAGEGRQLVISISSTEKAILEFARERIGAGKITFKRTSRPHHAPGLTYALCNRQALNLLEQLTPYLRSYKKGGAELIGQHYVRVTPRNGKYTAAMRAAKEAFEVQLLALRPNRSSD